MALSSSRNWCSAMGLAFLVLGWSGAILAADQIVQVIVNAEPLNEDDVQLMVRLAEGIEADEDASANELIDRMIDRELIRRDLQASGFTASPEVLQARLQALGNRLTQDGESIDQAFTRLQLNRTALQRHVGLSVAWDAYVNQEITDERLASEWHDRRAQLDGTRVKAAQIVKLVGQDAPEAEWTEATNELSILRERIRSGELTFSEAARQFSESPSGKNGGSLGEFSYSGPLDPAIIETAFSLKDGELSQPFRSRSAVHLVRTEERIPGTLNPEDVREQLIAELKARLWKERVQSLRENADIQIIKANIPDRRVLPGAAVPIVQ